MARTIVAALVLAVAVHQAHAAPPRGLDPEAFEELRQLASAHILGCSIKAQIALVKAESPTVSTYAEDIAAVGACIEEAKASTRGDFRKLSASLERRKAAQALFKDWHAAFLTAIDGTRPAPTEPTNTYKRRLEERNLAMQAVWNRFLVEAGF